MRTLAGFVAEAGRSRTTILEIQGVESFTRTSWPESTSLSNASSMIGSLGVWNANTVTCLPMSIICIRDTIISSTHTFMSGPSMNILTYFPYIRSPLTNILRAYCDIRSVFFIISRAFVDMYSARFTMCCQNFVICGSFSYRLALRSLRLTACGP